MKKWMKACIIWILLGVARLIQFPVSLIFFPLVYPFRKAAYNYTNRDDYKLFHPLSILSWFFTKEKKSGNWYTGPYWFKKEIKDKVFKEYTDEEKQDPIARSFKQKLIYFYLAYLWCAVRNFMWNLQRIMFRQSWDNNRFFRVIKSNLPPYIDIKLMPQAKFTDETGICRDNSGPLILYSCMTNNYLFATIEGKKLVIFYDDKDRFRFDYRYVKILPIRLFRTILIFELFIGWDKVDCSWLLHFKPMFKKYGKQARKNHREYLKYKEKYP